jgi:hypothetical protein
MQVERKNKIAAREYEAECSTEEEEYILCWSQYTYCRIIQNTA